MTLVAILIALVLAFIAFQFIKGIIKFAVILAIVLLGIFFVHQAGAL